MYRLLIQNPAGAIDEVDFKGEMVRFGRPGGGADVVLSGERVENLHAMLLLEGGRFLIEDLGSDAGTFVNGRKVQREAIRDGDLIEIAGHKVQLSMAPAESSGQTLHTRSQGGRVADATDDAIIVAVLEQGSDTPRELAFDQNEVTIGRVQGNDIVLPKSNVSKRHSRVVMRDDKLIVVDLKTTNGTYVNGKKVGSPRVIKSDDKVHVGDFTLTFRRKGDKPPEPLPGPPSSHPKRTAKVDGRAFAISVHEGPQRLGERTFRQATVTIGRGADNDVVIHHDAVSKHHCRLHLKDGRLVLVDLRSTTGTFVDGQPVSGTPIVLEGATEIMLGSVLELRVSLITGKADPKGKLIIGSADDVEAPPFGPTPIPSANVPVPAGIGDDDKTPPEGVRALRREVTPSNGTPAAPLSHLGEDDRRDAIAQRMLSRLDDDEEWPA